MQCKNCERTIPDDAIFCQWCGEKQIKEKRKKKQGVSIPKIRQLPSGMYFCQLRLNGESISITDRDYDIVEAQAKAIKTGVIKKKQKTPELTLSEACVQYINSRSGRLSPSTIQGYHKITKNYFSDLQEMPISTITKKVLQSAYDNECKRTSRRGKPLAAKTINNAFFFIVSVIHEFSPGVESDIKIKEEMQKVPHILTPEEIIPVIKGTAIELPCLLAMWLSFTMSEIRGLTKSKSIVGDKIIITETVVDIDGKPMRKDDGKEEKRTRALQLPEYIKQLIDKVEGDVIVPLSGQAIYKRWVRLLEKNNLPHMRFHELRHVNASIMAELQIPEKAILERGGWKTDYVAKRVYTHTFTRQRRDADKTIDEYFEGIYNDFR